MKEKIKDIVVRALKTFIQGFLAVLVVTIQNGGQVDKAVLVGAIASGISALMNLVINMMNKEE